MPTLRIHGVSQEIILNLAEDMTKELAFNFETEEDNISLEIINSVFIRDGKLDSQPYPMIEILAFRRSEVIESQVAQTLTDIFKDAGFEYIEVFYIHLEESEYFCDGSACV